MENLQWIIKELNNIIRNVSATESNQRLAILTKKIKVLESNIRNFNPWIEINPHDKEGCASYDLMNIPNELEEVLIYIKTEDLITSACREGYIFFILDDLREVNIFDVSHYMQLPQKPKTDQNEAGACISNKKDTD